MRREAAKPRPLQAKAAVVSALSPGSVAAATAVQWIYEFQNNSAHVEDNSSSALELLREPAIDHFSPHYKLFALNSLENLIKTGWYSMRQEFREDMKLSLQSLLSDESLSANFLSDGLSRCVVEVMMREWPQKWPQLLPLLLSMPKKTSVLHVLWRLAEDVGIHFKPKNAQRRREILTTITEHLNLILGYIWDCLQSDQSSLCLLALKTLTAYLEWTPIEGQLIRFLCHILSTPTSPDNHLLVQSKTIACDCLVNLMGRKKLKGSEAEAIAVLFTDDILSVLFYLLR